MLGQLAPTKTGSCCFIACRPRGSVNLVWWLVLLPCAVLAIHSWVSAVKQFPQESINISKWFEPRGISYLLG